MTYLVFPRPGRVVGASSVIGPIAVRQTVVETTSDAHVVGVIRSVPLHCLQYLVSSVDPFGFGAFF